MRPSFSVMCEIIVTLSNQVTLLIVVMSSYTKSSCMLKSSVWCLIDGFFTQCREPIESSFVASISWGRLELNVDVTWFDWWMRVELVRSFVSFEAILFSRVGWSGASKNLEALWMWLKGTPMLLSSVVLLPSPFSCRLCLL